jgi:hypothetical protein
MTANLSSFEAVQCWPPFLKLLFRSFDFFLKSFQKFRHLFSGILLESGPFKTGFGEPVNRRDQKRPALETLHATFLTLHDEKRRSAFCNRLQKDVFNTS